MNKGKIIAALSEDFTGAKSAQAKVCKLLPTLRISVSGEPQNLFGNPKILPGIGSLEKLSGKLQIILEYYLICLGLASNFVLISGDVSFCLSMVNCKL